MWETYGGYFGVEVLCWYVHFCTVGTVPMYVPACGKHMGATLGRKFGSGSLCDTEICM